MTLKEYNKKFIFISKFVMTNGSCAISTLDNTSFTYERDDLYINRSVYLFVESLEIECSDTRMIYDLKLLNEKRTQKLNKEIAKVMQDTYDKIQREQIALDLFEF